MKKVKFVFAIHNHQPVGNFGHISEEAYQKSYLPLIEVIKGHPWFKVNLHYTGILLEWLESAHPEFIETLKGMVKSGQAEIMTGGYYEPILALLPDADKIGQIRKLTEYITSVFGSEPRGMWLAERVWEPHMPAPISSAGVDYVVVDDYHFKTAGFRDEELTGYFLTDEQGHVVRVFPGSERLRYTIPFREPEETIDYFRSLPDAGENTLAVMADDGEKFGIWPGTHKWVYDDGWFERFIKAVEDNSGWLTTTTFGEYAAAEGPRGRAYLPTSSYMEMGEWSLSAGAARDYEKFIAELEKGPDFAARRAFVKGGTFRNFLAKYPESGAMQKRMLHVSSKVHSLTDNAGKTGKPGAGKAKGSDAGYMLDQLWQGQCNDAYWHGVFGGLYLPHLRDAVYSHLIKAEEAADRLIYGKGGKGAGWLGVEVADINRDLNDEVFISNPGMAMVIAPARGGSISELDFRPVSMNFGSTLARRWEAYHDKIVQAASGGGAGESDGGAVTIHERVTVKQEGLSELLHYDWYERASLIDHFLGPDVDLESFSRADYHEAGDFVTGGYGFTTKKTAGRVKVSLSRAGSAAGVPVTVVKEISAAKDKAGFDAAYTVTNTGEEELNTTFGVEFGFSLMVPDAHDRYFVVPGHVLKSRNFASMGEVNSVSGIKMVDEWKGYELALEFGSEAVLWRFPVETVSQSEAGFEKVYQSSVVMPTWRLSLRPGESWSVDISLSMDRRE